jgi:hypothetical protein
MNFLKSKTLNFNVLVPALVGILMAFGVEIPVEVVTGVLAIGNFILRFFTEVPLSEK